MSFIANIFRISATVEFQSLSIGFEIEVLAWKILQKFLKKRFYGLQHMNGSPQEKNLFVSFQELSVQRVQAIDVGNVQSLTLLSHHLKFLKSFILSDVSYGCGEIIDEEFVFNSSNGKEQLNVIAERNFKITKKLEIVAFVS